MRYIDDQNCVGRLNLRHLLAVETVTAEGSVSAAAAALALSQSALTQALARLEQHLGVRLFERGRGGATPTAVGSAVAARTARLRRCLESGLAAAGLEPTPGGGYAAVLRRLTTTRLEYFVQVAIGGSFSVAARTLGVSQPSLHRAVRETEAVIGTPCFRQRPQGVEVLTAGSAFARLAALALNEMRQIEDTAAEARGEAAGRIALGSLPLGHVALVPEALTRLIVRYPDARISVSDGTYTDLLRDLRYGRIDWLVGALRLPAPAPDVVEQHLFDEGLAVFVRTGHPALGWPSVTSRRLATLSWITPRESTPARTRFDGFFRSEGLAFPERVISCGSILTARELMKRTDYAGLFSKEQLGPEVETGQLAILSRFVHGAERPIGVAMRADWQPTRLQEAFTRILAETAAAQGSREGGVRRAARQR